MLYFIVFITAVLQITAVNMISIGGIKPDFLLILTVFIAIKKDLIRALCVAVLAGFLKDIFSTGAFINTLSFPAYAVLTGVLCRKFYFSPDALMSKLLIVFAVCAIDSAVQIFCFSNMVYPPSALALIIYVGLPGILYTSLASIPVFSVFKNYAT